VVLKGAVAECNDGIGETSQPFLKNGTLNPRVKFLAIRGGVAVSIGGEEEDGGGI
jgi:hypothetical protein